MKTTSRSPRPVAWLWRKHWRALATALLLMLLTPYLASLPIRTIPLIIAMTSNAPIDTPSGDLGWLVHLTDGSLSVILLVLVVAGLAAFVLTLVNTYLSARLTTAAMTDIRSALHAHMLKTAPSAMRAGGGTDLIKTAILDQSRMVASYACNTLPAAAGVAFGVVVWGNALREAMAQTSGATAIMVVTAVIGLLAAINLMAVWLSAKRGQSAQHTVMLEQAGLIRRVSESVQSLASLQLHNAEQAQHRRFQAGLAAQNRAEVRAATWSGLASATSTGAIIIGTPLLVVAWLRLELPSAQLAVMIPALMMLQRGISSIGSLWTMRKMALPSIELVSQYIDDRPTTTLPPPSPVPAATANNLAIAIQGVSFSPADQPDLTILKSVDLHIPFGDTVAIVGRGGSGKSTLARMLVGLHSPSTGRILVGDGDIAELSHHQLRSRVGMLEQHPPVFSRSVRANLCLDDREVDDATIESALRLSRFDEVVNKLEGGLDHELAGDDSTLSGSERRRLALARLLVRDCAIIVIDELEAGLPQADAQNIFSDLRAATVDKTCVVVTHRPDLLASDNVAFLHEGSILANAPHEELASTCAPYRALLAETRKETSDDKNA